MRVLLKNANVLTLDNACISYFTDILLEDGLISAIGKGLPAVDNCSVIDCSGAYVMPALFDAHAHLNTSEMGRMFIANGITSIRNLCGAKRHLKLDAEIRAGISVGPYIYSSSPIYDGDSAKDRFEGHIYLSTGEEAEKAVYDSIEAGFLWVKTYPSLTREQTKRMLDTANAAGIKVCGHMSHSIDAKLLCDWGYYCVEHSSSLPPHPADIAYLAKNGMWFCPTQVVCETLPDYVWNGKKLTDLEHYDYVPQPVKAYWEKYNESIIAGYKKRGLRPDIQIIIDRGRAFMEFSNQYMAGSDTMYPGMIAGFSLHEELERLVNLYGCTPYEALKAATVNPALLMGLERHKGRLLPGMDADILILNDNPLADIKNTRSIQAVIQGDNYYDRSRLDAILEEVRTLPDSEVEFLAPLL